MRDDRPDAGGPKMTKDALTMRFGRSSMSALLALALAISLCGGSLAAAAPGDTSATPEPAPRPAAPPSVLPVPVDPGTQAFRSELEKRQAALDAFRAQLDELDRQLAIAAEEYNGAAEQLKITQDRLDVTRSDLGAANRALGEQQDLLDTRIIAMYRDGELSPTEILFGSRSVPDFFARVEFIRTISVADADLAGQLSSQRDSIAGREIDLQAAEIQARALEFALKSRKVEIELRIAEREKLMGQAQADLVTLLDSEAARRSGDELSLWREIMAGASGAGVSIEPFTPSETVLSYHGIPYIWAGAAPSGFDCSGLTMYVMRQHGVSLPHHAASQILLGEKVAPSDMRAGDLVFFGSPVYHVGMYIGGGYFVHAPRTGDFVKVSRLADRHDFVGARRYPWRYRTGKPMGVAGVSLPAGLPSASR
jgi:peptidoglycan hydrolase CwlO-like protein